MKKQIDVLYNHYMENHKDGRAVHKSLERIHDAVVKMLPEGQEEAFMGLIVRNQSNAERQGFLAGFRVAVRLFTELEGLR